MKHRRERWLGWESASRAGVGQFGNYGGGVNELTVNEVLHRHERLAPDFDARKVLKDLFGGAEATETILILADHALAPLGAVVGGGRGGSGSRRGGGITASRRRCCCCCCCCRRRRGDGRRCENERGRAPTSCILTRMPLQCCRSSAAKGTAESGAPGETETHGVGGEAAEHVREVLYLVASRESRAW